MGRTRTITPPRHDGTKRLRIELDSVFEFDRTLKALPFKDEDRQIMALYQGFEKVVREVFGEDVRRCPGRGHHQFSLDFRPSKGRATKKDED